MRIALIKLSALGDIVHLGVFLPALKRAIPELSIEWFVDEAFAPLLHDSPLVDRLHALPLKRAFKSKEWRTLGRIARELRALERFEMVIDAQGLLKSALIAALLPARARWGFDRVSAKEGIAALFYTHKVAIPYHEHILKRNATLLATALQIPMPNPFTPPYRGESFGASSAAKVRIAALLEGDGAKKVLLVLEASRANKIYPKERFLELSRLCPEESLYLLWHGDEAGARFLAQENPRLKLLPRLSLDEVKALLACMDLVIGGDTGVTHLAWALERPSITLFGNTPLERFALGGEKHRALRSSSARDYDKADFSIADIAPQAIRHAMEELL